MSLFEYLESTITDSCQPMRHWPCDDVDSGCDEIQAAFFGSGTDLSRLIRKMFKVLIREACKGPAASTSRRSELQRRRSAARI